MWMDRLLYVICFWGGELGRERVDYWACLSGHLKEYKNLFNVLRYGPNSYQEIIQASYFI